MKTLSLSIIVLCMMSCSLGMDIERHLFGNYYLTAPDIQEQLSLSYREYGDGYAVIIEETVFAVGYNKDYIIAKQHSPTKAFTNYFILPIKHKGTWGDPWGLIGPLTFDEFTQKRKELKIENLNFSVIYKDLE